MGYPWAGNVRLTSSDLNAAITAAASGTLPISAWGSASDATRWMTADGTDQRANLVTALAARAGRILHIPKGTYTLDYTSNVSVSLPANSIIEGDGPESILSITGATGTRTIFNVLASGVTLRNLKLALSGPAAGSTTVFFAPGGGASNLVLDHVTIDGAVADAGGGSVTNTAHVILPVGTVGSGFTGIGVCNGTFSNLSRLYFRTSVAGQTAAIKRLRFINNECSSFYRAAISINSPFGETSDVVIWGNRFTDNFSKTTGGTDDYFIGVGSGKTVRIIANDMSGAGDGIHIEEAAQDQIIEGNTLALTDADAEAFYVSDNNVGTGSYVAPINITIASNVAKGPGSGTATKFGVRLVNDASGTAPVKGVTIAGNTFTGFARGISVTSEDEIATIADNTLRSNAIGLWSVKPLLQARDNLFDSNTEDLHSSQGGMWGTNDFLAIPTLSTDAGKIAMDGFRLTLNSITLGATTTTLVDMATLGAMAAGRVTAHYRQATAVYQMASLDFDYDGTTLNTLSGRIGGDGAGALNGLALDSGKLALSFTNSGAALTGGRVQINFSGIMGAN